MNHNSPFRTHLSTQAAMRMLDNRKLSSKINYNVLANLFDAPVPESPSATGKPSTAAAERESAALTAELAASKMKGGWWYIAR